MNGYLIAEEGPLVGITLVFEEELEGNTWSLGRDPETSDVVLEDPMVSRKHATIRLTSEGFVLENLSTVNPVTQNGMVVADPVLLKEGDIVQIGSTFFHFTTEKPATEEMPTSDMQEMEAKSIEEKTPSGSPAEMSSDLHFGPSPETRWLLKVISGPNAGAEFAMHSGSTYLIGKDPNICDIVFQDLSVSRQHARLTLDREANVFIEDLGSRNGVIVNGELIDEKQLLSSQDLVALGTTTFLVVDRHEARETIFSPATLMPHASSTQEKDKLSAKAALRPHRDWKELIIPKKHLIFAAAFAGVIFVSIFAMLSLFKSEPVVAVVVNESGKIQEALAKFPGVTFSYNQASGKLFLIGHVTTSVDHQELVYNLKQLPFISKMEDTVIVDELVWQSMNNILSINPAWIGVSMYAPTPGEFVLRGYVDTLEDAEELRDYVNINFDYLDKLKNKVVTLKNLETEMEARLLEKGFTTVTFQLSNGEVVFSGKIDSKEHSSFNHLLLEFDALPGIQTVKNYVVVTTGDSTRVDISKNFRVSGYSKRDNKDFFVVINGKILGEGDRLDEMLITQIKPKVVFLEHAGMKYKIDFNLQ